MGIMLDSGMSVIKNQKMQNDSTVCLLYNKKPLRAIAVSTEKLASVVNSKKLFAMG
jgi:hypothetical protein